MAERSLNRDDPAAWPTGARAVRRAAAEYTELDWEVHPDGLRRVLAWVTGRYGSRPLYVTENGAAFADPPADAAGRIADARRVEYFRTHVAALREAVRQGADVRGYFAWSLLDNYEWACGYAKTFGLVAVDRVSLRRTVKDSGRHYRETIARGDP